MESGRVWDLTEANRGLRSSRPAVWPVEVVFGLIVGLLSVSKGAAAGWALSPTGSVVIGGGIVAAGICFGFAGIAAAPLAARVVVSADGVVFRYPSGATRTTRWRDPMMKLSFTDARFTSVVLARPDEVLWKVKFNEGAIGLRASPLSEEAHVDLITEAARQGCQIVPRDWRARDPTRHVVWVEGRAAPA